MLSSIVSGHNHQRTIGNDFVGLYLYFATHPYRRVNKMDYCVTFMLLYRSCMVTSNFANNRENGKRELCLNVVTPCFIIVCNLVVS